MANSIPETKKADFIGQLIDIFEDFLDEKGISIENEERDEDDDSAAIIFGSDYDALAEQLTETMTRWGVLKKEEAAA